MKKSILFSLLIFLNIAVYAKVYKVSNAADIQSAARRANPGDVILMENKIWVNEKIIFKANGNAQNPIVLAAETAGKVQLSGNSTLLISGNYLTVSGLYFKDGVPASPEVVRFANNSSYCRLTNCAIINYNPANKDQDCKWVILDGTHNRIDHCNFREKNTAGPLVSVVMPNVPNYDIIDSNYFGHRPEQGKNGAEIIRIGFGQPTANIHSFTTVEYNYFEECDGEKEVISNKSSNNTFRYNTFYKCRGTLSLRQGKNCIVEGNFFLGEDVDHTGGVKISGQNHQIINNYFANLRGKNFMAPISFLNGDSKDTTQAALHPNVRNITIANNTFINNDNNVVIGIAYENKNANVAPEDIKLQNNVFYTSKQQFINQVTKAINLQAQNNTFAGGDPGINTENNNRIASNLAIKKTDDGLYTISDNNRNLVTLQRKPIRSKDVGTSWPVQ